MGLSPTVNEAWDCDQQMTVMIHVLFQSLYKGDMLTWSLSLSPSLPSLL